ncbi:MAG: hypothetical protein ABSH28_05305 [Acidobacteriota bacterium]|jgi:hypothetical protein
MKYKLNMRRDRAVNPAQIFAEFQELIQPQLRIETRAALLHRYRHVPP